MKNKKMITHLVAMLLALSTTALIGFKSASESYKVGSAVADFKLKNVDDKMISLSNYPKAKGAIVVFTCNHCPFAKKYEQRIIDLNTKYASLGYPVIAINPNDPAKVEEDSYSNMQKQAKKKGYQFPYVIDETQEVAKTFGATKTPHVYILQNDSGKYLVKYIGAIDDNVDEPAEVKSRYVEEAIASLMAGKPVVITETKAIGCTIKWK